MIDDTEMEEEGVAELLLDDNAVAAAPRPGTKLAEALDGLTASRWVVARRASMTNSGRPASASPALVRTAVPLLCWRGRCLPRSRPGTSRPVTTSGRFVRLGTASLRSDPGGPFIDATRMDFKKYAQRPTLAKALCDYILYVDRNPKRALELCAECTQQTNFNDWWWKARLGRCYYQLGLLRDAEKQFKSSLKHREHIATVLELGKVYHRLDQPLTALDLFDKSAQRNPMDHHLLLGMARLYDQLNDTDKAVTYYKKVLLLDSSNIEAIACLASNLFYEDQPEIALRLYRRLLQMGVSSTELWNNLGLCCSTPHNTIWHCLASSVRCSWQPMTQWPTCGITLVKWLLGSGMWDWPIKRSRWRFRWMGTMRRLSTTLAS